MYLTILEILSGILLPKSNHLKHFSSTYIKLPTLKKSRIQRRVLRLIFVKFLSRTSRERGNTYNIHNFTKNL